MATSSTKGKAFKRFAPIVCVALVVLLTAMSLCACKNRGDEGDNLEAFAASYKSTTRVEYDGEILGTVDRQIPSEVKNGGSVSSYPVWDHTKNYSAAEKQAIINESWGLTSIDTQVGSDGKPKNTYNSMDAFGNLYLNGQMVNAFENAFKSGYVKYTPAKLYKHTAAVGLYGGNVSDSEPAVIKRVTLYNRGYTSYSVTGLYAPAGEVIKVEISGADMDKSNGIRVHIGQALYNQKANNIWTQRAINRMPVILNTMVVTKSTATYDAERDVWTAYVGSFVGGPIYVQNVGTKIDVTFSGAVQYRHFILGYTSPEEFAELSKSTAPYFDLEVWERGVLHSGPLSQAKKFTYDQLYDAAVLWEKIALVTAQCYSNYNNQGIVFIYDCFVAAGAAVAFPGQNSVNCPYGWMSGSLNYTAFVNGGSWGNMHEYNHNFQGYGVGGGGEVTNNAMTLVSYSLYTRISRSRGVNNYGVSGLSGWNRFTSATWATKEVINKTWGGNGKNGLALYAALLHNFGQDAFINARKQANAQSYVGYFNGWTKATHNDMSYFFNDILGGGVSEDAIKAANGDKNYPLFVPVASVYQTGRSYTYDGQKRYFDTMQPYVIKYDSPFVVDLNKYTGDGNVSQTGSVVIPDRFEYTINSVTNNSTGTISDLDLAGKKFTFNPGTDLFPGKILVNISIKDTQGQYTNIDDVDLVLQFEQSHEMNKSVLQKDIYSYTDSKYDSAKAAYEANFAGASSSELKVDHANPKLNGKIVQNCNAEIWYIDMLKDDGKTTDDGIAPAGTVSQVAVLSGKVYINEDAKYRFSARGRRSVALYLSFDGGNTFEFACEYNGGTGATFPTAEGTYKDYELKNDTWVYFKLVLLRDLKEPRNSFVGLGLGKFVPAVYEKYAEDDDQGHKAGDLKMDANGNPIVKTPESVSVGYASAYRNTYEMNNSAFKTDYHYTRTYGYSYSDVREVETKQTVLSSQYQPWDSSDTYKIENLVDGNSNTYIHNNKNNISESNPFGLEVALGDTITANRMTFHGTAANKNAATYLPKTFRVWVKATEGGEWQLVADVANSTRNNLIVNVDFDKYYTFKYYKVLVTDTHSTGYNKYIALDRIAFYSVLELKSNGKNYVSADNDMLSYKGDWTVKTANSFFGHVYVGNVGATAEFEFEGKYFAIFSTSEFSGKFEVYVDGNKVDSIPYAELTSSYVVGYLSSELSEGKHSVKIVCADSNANIAAIATWQ